MDAAPKRAIVMSFELSQEEGKFLINLARNTVKEYLRGRQTNEPPKDTPKKLFEHCGVFVTISSFEKRTRRSFAVASATLTRQVHLSRQLLILPLMLQRKTQGFTRFFR